MNIALIAHDAKKELLVQFCIAYCGIISRHDVCATGTTGNPGTIVPGDPNPGTNALHPIIFDGITVEDWADATIIDKDIN